MTKSLNILIVDDDEDFLKSVHKESQDSSYNIINTSDFKVAQKSLGNKEENVVGLFINLDSGISYGISVIKAAHFHRPGIPIYILQKNSTNQLTAKEIRKLGVQKIIHGPISFKEIMALFTTQIKFSHKKAIIKARKNKDKLDSEIDDEDSSFIPIKAYNFISGKESFFDIYIRLNNNKYLLILKAGDSFSNDRLEKYINNGVDNFYIRKDIQKLYLDYCENLTDLINKSNKIDENVKLAQTLNYGEETLNFLKETGLSDENLEYVDRFTKYTRNVIQNFDLEAHDKLKVFLSETVAYDHGVSCAMISAPMLKILSFDSDKFMDLVALSCMLHDVALPKELTHEKIDNMSVDEKVIFLNHPEAGSKLIAQIKNLPANLEQVILHHHEKKSGKGFPNKLRGGSINTLASLIGICDAFLHIVKDCQEDSNLNPFELMEKNVFEDFPHNIVQSFVKVYINKE